MCGNGKTLRLRLLTRDVTALCAAWGILGLVDQASGAWRGYALSTGAAGVTLVVMYGGGLYRSRACAVRSLEANRTIAASVVGAAFFIGAQAIIGAVGISATSSSSAGPVAAAAVAAAAVVCLRWQFGRWLKARRAAAKFLRTVVMVGANEDAEELWTLLNEEPELGYCIGGVAGYPRPGALWESLPHCGDLEHLSGFAERVGANGVILVASALTPSERRQVMQQALAVGLHVQVWPGLCGLSSRRARMSPISGVPLLYIEPRRVASWQLAMKRGIDIVLAAGLCVVNAPLLLVVAVAIKLTDGGPVVYRSQRVGRYGTTIYVLKLRTMVEEAAEIDVEGLNERTGGPLFKASDDPRVTKIGRFLRATSIDELPQLWNVLNGTMSLVGPRPALVEEVEHFDAELRRRHEMRPGITGLWQVEARDNPSFSAYRRHDLSYVDDWSLGLDAAILAGTAYELVVRAFKTVAEVVRDREQRPLKPEHKVSGAEVVVDEAL